MPLVAKPLAQLHRPVWEVKMGQQVLLITSEMPAIPHTAMSCHDPRHLLDSYPGDPTALHPRTSS